MQRYHHLLEDLVNATDFALPLAGGIVAGLVVLTTPPLLVPRPQIQSGVQNLVEKTMRRLRSALQARSSRRKRLRLP